MSEDLTLVEQKELTIENKKLSQEIALKQTAAFTTLAESVRSIAQFLSGGGLTEVLSGYTRISSVRDILAGLVTHDGRDALDARHLAQNAIEIVHHVEAGMDKYKETIEARAKPHDPELHDAETPLKDWIEKQKAKPSP